MTWTVLPGETPIDDLSGLIDKGIRTRAQLNRAEAENILDATIKYLSGTITEAEAPFDLTWMRRLHEEMFGKVWSWAGQLRQIDLNFGVAWQHVEQRLYDLSLCIPYWANETWETQAAMLHHRAVQIHPFLNGNGRWSRMLANIWSWRNGQAYTQWPEDAIGVESPIRAEYVVAIQAADKGNLATLVRLHERFKGPSRSGA